MSKNKQPSKVGDSISNRLKEYYASVENEPIPEHFLDLLEKLDEAEEKSKSGSADGKSGDRE